MFSGQGKFSSLPFRGNAFNLVDCWSATTVTSDKRTVTCSRSCKSTNYSTEVFTGTDNFDVVVAVTDLQGGKVGVGIVGHDQHQQCCNFTPGETEISRSLGCFVGGGEVQLMIKDNTFFRGNCDTRTPVLITMRYRQGKLSFIIDRGLVNSDELQSMTIRGMFRLGVSVVRQGQTARIAHVGPPDSADTGAIMASLLSDAVSMGGGSTGLGGSSINTGGSGAASGGDLLQALSAALAGGATKYPSEPFAGTFHLLDKLRSIDITGNGTEAICRRSVNATVVSKEVFNADTDTVNYVMELHDLRGDLVAFGVVDDDETAELGRRFVGEKELKNSIGCLVKPTNVRIVLGDSILTEGTFHFKPERIGLRVAGGKLSFTVNGTEVACTGLESRRLHNKWRLGVSLTEQGQRASIRPGLASTSTGKTPNAAATAAGDRATNDDVARAKASDLVIDGTVPSAMLPNGAYPRAPFVENFNWFVPSDASQVSRTGTTLRSNVGSTQVAFVTEVCCVKKHNGIVCDRCRYGDGGAQFLTNRWRCRDCPPSFDLCDGCFIKSNWLHNHPKSSFDCHFGGGFVEFNVEVEPRGRLMSLVVSAAGKEGEVARNCAAALAHQTFAPSSKMKLSIRLTSQQLLLVKDGSVEKAIPVPEGTPLRFGVVFHEAGQSASIIRGTSIPRLGTPVTVTSDFAALQRAAAYVHGLKVYERLCNQAGWVTKHDCDGTVAITTNSDKSLWIPITALNVCEDPAPPSCTTVAVGDRVIRNPTSWKWMEQDGFSDGLVNNVGPNGWATVVWNNGIKNDYRFGAQGNFDVVRAVREGDRVVRNPAYWTGCNEDQGGVGTVVKVGDKKVDVRWPDSTTHTYAFGPATQEVQFFGGKLVRHPAGDTFTPNSSLYAGSKSNTDSEASPKSATNDNYANSASESSPTTHSQSFSPASPKSDTTTNTTSSPAGASPAKEFWACEGCTSRNKITATRCAMCNGGRPGSNWQCKACQYTMNPEEQPMCGSCRKPKDSATASTTATPPPPATTTNNIATPPPPAAAQTADTTATAALISATDARDLAGRAAILDPTQLPSIKLSASYKPPTGADLIKALEDMGAAFEEVPEMEHIVAESAQIARTRMAAFNDHGPLTFEQALVVAMYTFDLGAMSDKKDLSDNFYFAFNACLRSREPSRMQALKPYIATMKSAMSSLPSAVMTVYRGVPASTLSTVTKEYPSGKSVHWSGFTSVSQNPSVAKRFAGPHGVLFVINMVDGRDLRAYSCIRTEGEYVMLPDTKLTVVGNPSVDLMGFTVFSLQQVAGEYKF